MAKDSSTLCFRKGAKRKKNCSTKCRRLRQDEAHWTKVLQASTNSVTAIHSPPAITTPPASPMAVLGQSVSRFISWFSPNKRSASGQKYLTNSDGERPTSVSSEDSGPYPESPRPIADYPYTQSQQSHLQLPPPTQPATILKPPASSTLLTKRVLERHHQIQRPVPIQLSTANNTAVAANELLEKLVTSIPEHQRISQLQQSTQVKLITKKTEVEVNAESTGQQFSCLSLQVPPNRSPLTVTLSCPSSQKSLRSLSINKDHLSATWPPNGHHLSYVEEEDEEVFDDEGVHGCNTRNIQEFTIPHEDVSLDKLVGAWKYGEVYKGRWHGPAMIQTYHSDNPLAADKFWDEVKRMARIRHENIALFLGACTETGNLSLVTSVCNGCSLYDKLHRSRDKTTTLTIRLQLCYQMAQALAYLHSRNIVHKHLNARNVFVEKQKVTLSVIDYTKIAGVGLQQDMERKKHQLPYLAPELLSFLNGSIEDMGTELNLPCSLQTDVYAFGILLFETLSATRPYDSIPNDALIFQVINGRRPPIQRLNTPPSINALIESCWSHLSHHRVHTQHILSELLKKDISLHNRFSSSEPDSLNKLKGTGFMF